MNLQQAAAKMDKLGVKGIPFFFMIDFLGKNVVIQLTDKQSKKAILFHIGQYSNVENDAPKPSIKPKMKLSPISFEKYYSSFKYVQSNLQQGNSFLVNLTFPTPIKVNYSLEEIFHASQAKYRVLSLNNFVCFSPETFVKIENGKIYSKPMKGTISAAIPNAKAMILADQKELAEHTTIVDLIRNDLSIVAYKVQVEKFRYVEKITTNRGSILQVSSSISGTLPKNYTKKIGSIISKLLPAGSISGAPKPKTLEIIKHAEGYNRGYYTGICGFFDGTNLDSGVMIRFIESTENGMIFKSGGGITAFSDAKKEYEELIAKVYLPFA